jgi:hypothetical protein
LCQGHEELQEQRLKERFKFNFNLKNIIFLNKNTKCARNIKIDFYYVNIWKYEHDKPMVQDCA